MTRDAMLDVILGQFRRTRRSTGRAAPSPAVIEALRRVPREEFVPDHEVSRAHADSALPIGCGQTISQPYIVALMTDLLDVQRDHVVLEVGTGSGYQAAVLAQLAREVYTVEIIEELARAAERRLARAGCANVHVRVGDGSLGWAEHAPFDRIIVTAAGPEIPEPLIEQLAAGGRLVLPYGSLPSAQRLTVVDKDPDGAVRERGVLSVVFVPLTGAHGAR